jgi:hypothetical protein
MPGLYEIHWLPEGRTEKFAGSRGNYYEFSDTDRLDLDSVPVWCHRCAKITHGESLPSLDEIDQQIHDLHDPASDLYHMTRHGVLDEFFGKGQELLQEQLAKLQRRRQWRATRKSPPKCIHCGSAEIIELPLGKPVANPAGAGEIELQLIGMCSTSFNEWFFTPEGDRIPRETQPTYWHHPELDKPKHRSRLMKWLRSKMKGGGASAT